MLKLVSFPRFRLDRITLYVLTLGFHPAPLSRGVSRIFFWGGNHFFIILVGHLSIMRGFKMEFYGTSENFGGTMAPCPPP